jgi:hypothetical protein
VVDASDERHIFVDKLRWGAKKLVKPGLQGSAVEGFLFCLPNLVMTFTVHHGFSMALIEIDGLSIKHGDFP